MTDREQAIRELVEAGQVIVNEVEIIYRVRNLSKTGFTEAIQRWNDALAALSASEQGEAVDCSNHLPYLNLKADYDELLEAPPDAARDAVLEEACNSVCPLCAEGVMLKIFSGPATDGWPLDHRYFHDAGTGSTGSGYCKAAAIRALKRKRGL